MRLDQEQLRLEVSVAVVLQRLPVARQYVPEADKSATSSDDEADTYQMPFGGTHDAHPGDEIVQNLYKTYTHISTANDL